MSASTRTFIGVSSTSRTFARAFIRGDPSGARSTEIVDFIAGEAALIVGKVEPLTAMVDADDALVLAEAVARQAEMFVTGDAALLKLAAIENLKVVSPRQFCEVLHADRR
jgi:predicted nucleic acid-binding protein